MSFPEQDRAVQILEKEFGPRWKQIVQELGTKELRQRVGKELTSFMAFPERGSGGNNKWRGNCSPEVVRAILRYVLECKHYYGKQTQDFTLLDPMSGSGTSQAAAQSLGVRSLLYDLNPAPACGIGGWDALRDEVDDSADLIFLHPPYHNLIPYSGNMWGTPHKDDLSRCSSYPEFVEKLNYIVQKLFMALRRDGRLAILVGDIRTKGSFYSMQHDLMRVGQMEAFIVKGQYNCVSDTRSYKKPFIPVVTEYLLLFHKQDALFFPFAVRRETTVDLRKEDIPGLTWHHLIRLTMEELSGRAKLSDLGDRLAAHPKAKKNPHFRDRIRATAYLGRLKELMDGKRKNGYAYGRGEKYSLELGGDINRAIASEFAMLAAPETLPLFLRKLQRKALKQYQRREPICKGSGDIICMLDESSSAESQAPWCKAVALALLDIAMRDQRRFAVIHFAGVGDVQTDLFLPGQYDREDVLRCAETFLNGNTDYETPLREALRLMEQEGFENADMVFVTDGECVLPDSFLEKLKAEQSARGFQITGILLDQEDAGFEFSLRESCTNVYRTSQLSRDQIAEQLVVSRVA